MSSEPLKPRALRSSGRRRRDRREPLLYGRPDLIENKEYFGRQSRVNHIEELWEIIKPWYAERTKREIFQNALDTP